MHYPTITLDRAQAIADAAVEAGLAEAPLGDSPYRYGPALQAKLAERGVTSPLALSVEQAEEVEAFIAREGRARGAA